ncbi:hypothetical protein EDC04DRAFT_2613548 [Pisolithus marmoratus]|nr:hypothetical protein EDC04DRAFT_2613548 [Pisolithus marmoratus]
MCDSKSIWYPLTFRLNYHCKQANMIVVDKSHYQVLWSQALSLLILSALPHPALLVPLWVREIGITLKIVSAPTSTSDDQKTTIGRLTNFQGIAGRADQQRHSYNHFPPPSGHHQNHASPGRSFEPSMVKVVRDANTSRDTVMDPIEEFAIEAGKLIAASLRAGDTIEMGARCMGYERRRI